MKHGGDRTALAREALCEPEEILDFSVNLNPLGAPGCVAEAYYRAFDKLNEYPSPYAEKLSARLAQKLGMKTERILFGNGSNQLLALIPFALRPKRALIAVPSYLEYRTVCERAGVPVETFRLNENFELDFDALSARLQTDDLVILGSPNNPDGALRDPAELRKLAETHPNAQILVDEAFIDFAGEDFSVLAHELPPNLSVLRSMTKFYAIPGLRLGCCIGTLAEKLREFQPEWMLSAPAEAVAEAILAEESDYAERSRELTAELRGKLAHELARIPGLHVFHSDACYLLLRGRDPRGFLLKKHKIAIRSCGNYDGLSASFFRVAVRNEKENERLVSALRDFYGAPAISTHKKRPALMLQGTSSNAGKSVLSAAFCRILLQDGFRVAPFKAQNMALNSFVTPDGGEMGRAQAVQAQACRMEPDVRMNPVLLKPSSDTGSQVIVRGKPIGSMRVREYYAHKKELWKDVTRAYDELSAEADVMVLEGAGSPGEINLKSGDIVNMNMARHADASVLLVGDIDRGGVYASFLGTCMTLAPAERALLAGFLVNRFRGDPSLLAPAHEYLLRCTGKPVLGVVDYLRNLALPEEDSVNFALTRPLPKLEKTLDVALIALGHIANFTDFTPLEQEPDVSLRKVFRAEEFGSPDVVIMPGSKNVAEDLRRLRAEGLDARISDALRRGAWYVGVCGGLQIAGRTIADPLGIESHTGSVQGLGLLPLDTVLHTEKTLRRTVAREGNIPVSGYEIHHGETSAADSALVTQIREDGSPVGFGAGRICTTYLHGIFDDDIYRRAFLNRIRASLGLPELGVLAHYEIETALDALAAHVRSRVDMNAIYARLGLRR